MLIEEINFVLGIINHLLCFRIL